MIKLDLKVVNLWGGPGCGKSTTRAGLFHAMKRMGLRVEEATEYAKDLTYSRDFGTLGNQLLVLAEQDQRLHRLVGSGVEWVITDSPLPLGLVYADAREYGWWFSEAVYGAYSRYDNYDFLLGRHKAYVALGRTQTEREAKALDSHIARIFARASMDHITRTWRIPGDDMAVQEILFTLGLVDSSTVRR